MKYARLGPNVIRVTQVSPRTGQANTMDLRISEQQLSDWLVGGELIQNVMPHLTPDEREFLLTGYTAEDWNAIFPE